MTEDKNATITLKKDTLWKVGTFVFALLFVITLLVSIGLPGTGQAVKNDDTGVEEQEAVNAKALIDENDPVLGDKDADVSIIEFSDFQCSFCARAYNDAISDFKNSKYFADGEVNLIYKHLPLNSIHPQAQKAAEAAECANRQGIFWEYHDILFMNQNALDVSSLKHYANQLGLDTEEFNSCLDNNEATEEISKELAQATAAGARGTPYFVVVNNDNGDATSVSGAVPFTNFEAAINAVQ